LPVKSAKNPSFSPAAQSAILLPLVCICVIALAASWCNDKLQLTT
jgi:hypothetical protein